MTGLGERHALIVGVSNYREAKLKKLRAPAADAKELARVLKDPDIGDFDVVVSSDETEATLRRRIATFFSDRHPDDLLLLHFSCHGIKDAGGELYLAASDTEVGDLLGATGIASRWLSQQAARCRSKRIVVLLDCCYSGSFPFGMTARAGEDVNIESHLEGRGRAVITASSAMEYSYEGNELSGKGQPSVFTRTVVEGLETGKADRDGDKWISVDDLYDYVFDRVKALTPTQTPNKMSTLEGPLHIARSVYEPPVEPATLEPELVTLTRHPRASARAGAVTELETLLRADEPRAALAARQQLETMTDDDSRTVAAAATAALASAPRGRVEKKAPKATPPAASRRAPSARASSRSNERAPSRVIRTIAVLSAITFLVGFIVAASTSEGSAGNGLGGGLAILGFLGLVAAGIVGGVRKYRQARRSNHSSDRAI